MKQFDDLVEVFTDKLVAKIPSTCSGVVKSISFGEDDVCLVGHSLLEIETQDDAAAATSSSKPAEEAPKEAAK